MPSRKRASGTLGMFYPQRATGATVFGASVAVQDFVVALGRHAASPVDLWAPENRADAYSLLLRRAGASSKLSVRAYSAFAPELRGQTYRAWHDINSDPVRPFYLRSRMMNARFPVTITHHTISYESLRLSWFVPLLVGDIRPSDALICTSEAARSAVRNGLEHTRELLASGRKAGTGFRGRLEVIPLGIDTDVFRPRPKAPLKRRLGLSSSAFVLLWMGRISATDKADLLPLVQVFARLRDAHPQRELKLVIAGSDRELNAAYVKDFARRLGVARHVRVVTEAPPEERHLVHAAADVFVSPADNIQETFGLTPMEALACGVPQVVSDWDGYRDTVVHGETGFLVPTRAANLHGALDFAAPITASTMLDHLAQAQSVAVDTDGLEAALEQLILQPELRASMGAASRRRALALYAWPRVLASYEALWSELAAQAHSSRAPRRPGYLPPETRRVFSSYPTEWLDARSSARVEITVAGLDVLTGEHPLAAYYSGAGVSLDVVGTLLTRLARVKAVTVRELCRGEAVSLFHLVWLSKYGLVRLGSGA